MKTLAIKPVQPAILQFEVVSDGTKMEYVSSELNGWHTYKFVEAKENMGCEIPFSEKVFHNPYSLLLQQTCKYATH